MMDWVPIRRVDWARSEEGLISLTKSKFENRWMNRLIQRFGLAPTYRIKLDAYGSAVWDHCDGTQTAFEIAEQLKTQFSGIEDSAYQRVGWFLHSLAQQRCITLKNC